MISIQYKSACVVLGALLTVACTSPSTPATNSPTPGSSEPVAAVTIFPTATRLTPPTATSEKLPATATTGPLPTATVAPPVVLARPANMNPFTGKVIPPEALNRRPLLIKVANTAEVRPQSGLSNADVVVEHYSEGGITRFTALYLGKEATKIGSVRSCRLIDIESPAIFDASMVCSGTSPGVKPLMRDSWGFKNNVTMISDFGPYECADCPMFRTSGEAPPHNLFANTINARRELDARKKNTPTSFASWEFSDAPAVLGQPVNQLDVPYTSGVVGWKYDAEARNWQRSFLGEPMVDRISGKPVTADNVLLLYAPHIQTLIQEDVSGARSIEIQLWGKGFLKLARDGKLLVGNWMRNDATGTLSLVDPDGKPLPLKPGNTWIQLVPVGFKESVK